MIQGVGTDICDVRRVREILARHGDRFTQKILTDAELLVWRKRSARWPERGVRFLATRFSAKESLSKALGLGMRTPMHWRACEITNRASGEPFVVLHGALREWVEAKQWAIHISLSDESNYAASFCVIERL